MAEDDTVLTELDERIIKIGMRDEVENRLIIITVLGVREYGLQDETEAYLKEHPDTTFMELNRFVISVSPPLEIVDDDELEDDE